MRRFVLGVTGAVGAGKSAVCAVLARRGVPVRDVDDAAAEALIEALPVVAQRLPAVISTTGGVHKEALFAAMLKDAALRQDLEKLLQPLVLRRVRDFTERQQGLAVVEAALLFEAGLDALCDATICVQCPRPERQRRVALRATASARNFDSIEAAQWPESQKAARATIVLSTEGPLDQLESRLNEALQSLGLGNAALQ